MVHAKRRFISCHMKTIPKMMKILLIHQIPMVCACMGPCTNHVDIIWENFNPPHWRHYYYNPLKNSTEWATNKWRFWSKIINCSRPVPRNFGFWVQNSYKKMYKFIFSIEHTKAPEIQTCKFVCWYILIDDWVVPPKSSQKKVLHHKLVVF